MSGRRAPRQREAPPPRRARRKPHPQWVHPIVRKAILLEKNSHELGLKPYDTEDQLWSLDRRHAEYVVSYLSETPRKRRTLAFECNIRRDDGTMDVLASYFRQHQQEEGSTNLEIKLWGIPHDDGSLLEFLSKAAQENSFPFEVDLTLFCLDLKNSPDNKRSLEMLLLSKTRALKRLCFADCHFDKNDALFLQKGLAAQTGPDGNLRNLIVFRSKTKSTMLLQLLFHNECFLTKPGCKLDSLYVGLTNEEGPRVEPAVEKEWKNQLLFLARRQPSMSLRSLVVGGSEGGEQERDWKREVRHCLLRNKLVSKVGLCKKARPPFFLIASLVHCAPATGPTPIYLAMCILAPALADQAHVSRRRRREG